LFTRRGRWRRAAAGRRTSDSGGSKQRPQADGLQTAVALARRLAADRPPRQQRSSTFSSAEVRDSRLNPGDKADLAVAQTRQLVVRQIGDVTPVEGAGRSSGRSEAAEQVHERRACPARRTGERDELAGMTSSDTPRRARMSTSPIVGLRQVARGNEGGLMTDVSAPKAARQRRGRRPRHVRGTPGATARCWSQAPWRVRGDARDDGGAFREFARTPQCVCHL
jgi:hypothetical protein